MPSTDDDEVEERTRVAAKIAAAHKPSSGPTMSASSSIGDPFGRALQKIAERMPQASEQKKLENDLRVARLKSEAEMKVAPIAAWERQHVPGYATAERIAGRQRQEDSEWVPEWAQKYTDVRRYASDPHLTPEEMDAAPQRQPIQHQREFSSEEEKKRYLERYYDATATHIGEID